MKRDDEPLSPAELERFDAERAGIEREIGRTLNTLELLRLCTIVTRKKPTKD
jgi:hypothetical protein